MNSLDYISLYDEGFDRIGCIMCPLADPVKRWREYHRFPKTARVWEIYFQRLHDLKRDKYPEWRNGKEMFLWWMNR
jgi:phosphoadenosine phosphosulfate reductase